MPQEALLEVFQRVSQEALQEVPQEVPQEALQQGPGLFVQGDFARQTERGRYQRLISKSCTMRHAVERVAQW